MRIKKWYFCLSELSLDRQGHDWQRMVISSVNSALQNTTLEPNLVYDGAPSEFIRKLEEMGVNIIYHRVGFYQNLAKRGEKEPGYLAVAAGAYLRVEIPLIEKDEEYVLYTDCDVTFLADIGEIEPPKLFSLAPQFSKTDYVNDANTGVMIMNLREMRKDVPAFSEFVCENLYSGWPGFDQENFRRFYKGRWGKLPIELNWKPYWGKNQSAKIVHWHGPKPNAVINKLENEEYALFESWMPFYEMDKESYKEYSLIWREYLRDAGDFDPQEKVHGYIDSLNNKYIQGWMLNKVEKDRVVVGKFRINGSSYIPFSCSGYRRDLEKIYDVKVGAFKIELPEGLKYGERFVFEVIDRNGNAVEIGYEGQKAFIFDLTLRATVPNSPMMPAASVDVLREAMSGSECYLEFGMGGSTVMACHVGVAELVSVESDFEWLEGVKEKVEKLSGPTKKYLLHGNIGPTGPVGYPASESSWRTWHNYPLRGWVFAQQQELKPDLVLIDGRFRVACLLASLLFARPGCRILFDDYGDRTSYHVVERFVAPVRMVDRVAEFIVPTGLPRDDVWQAFIVACSDPS